MEGGPNPLSPHSECCKVKGRNLSFLSWGDCSLPWIMRKSSPLWKMQALISVGQMIDLGNNHFSTPKEITDLTRITMGSKQFNESCWWIGYSLGTPQNNHTTSDLLMANRKIKPIQWGSHDYYLTKSWDWACWQCEVGRSTQEVSSPESFTQTPSSLPTKVITHLFAPIS